LALTASPINSSCAPAAPITLGMPYSLAFHSLLSTFVQFSHRQYALAVTTLSKPSTFAQANQFPHWRDAMHTKLTALDTNHT
jgi:hypothetical protein